MGTLADLFVSYRSVEPESEVTPERKQRLSNLLDGRGRLEQFEENLNPSTSNEESNSDLENAESEEALNELDEEIKPENVNPNATSPIDKGIDWLMSTLSPEVKDQINPNNYQPENIYYPSGKVVKYNRGHLDAEIKNLFDKAGIKIRVTSGARKAGQAGKSGSKSHHIGGNAVDIVPADGETFESIKQKMKSNPEILQFFYENGLGVIDETDAATMKKTGATGKHFHIGPDNWAVKTWASWTNGYKPSSPNQRDWARNLYNAFLQGLSKEYKNQYSPEHYKKIAAYMTYQAALESGYGKHAKGFNYSGHMRNGKVINYNSLDEFVNAHIKTLKKWDFMKANSLREYVDSLYQGQYKYNASDSANTYYNSIKGTSPRINQYLGLYAKLGGKFQNIRQIYGESFSKYK